MSDLNSVLSRLNAINLFPDTPSKYISLSTINSDLSSLLSYSNSFPSNYANVTKALCNVQDVLNSKLSIYQYTSQNIAPTQKAINSVFVSNDFGTTMLPSNVSTLLNANVSGIKSLAINKPNTLSPKSPIVKTDNNELSNYITNIENIMSTYTLNDTFYYGNENTINPLIESVCIVQGYLNNNYKYLTSSEINTFNKFIQQFTFPSTSTSNSTPTSNSTTHL